MLILLVLGAALWGIMILKDREANAWAQAEIDRRIERSAFEALPNAVVCKDNIEGWQDCHTNYPTGCGPTGKYDAYLNLLKNQIIQPATPPLKFLDSHDFAALDKNTPLELSRTNHADFKDDLGKLGEGRVFGLIGYLYYAKVEGKESVNCELSGPGDADFHIGIGFDADMAAKLIASAANPDLTSPGIDRRLLSQTSIIVEMTPHYRARFKPNWTVALVRSAIGRQVRVIGQLIADNEHFQARFDCAFPGANQTTCLRSGIWELHPVIDFQVCHTPNDACAPNSGDWVALENFR